MICANCKQNEVTGVLFNGAGPADYCDVCKKHCYDIGKLIVAQRDAAITHLEAHIIMGALEMCYSEGTDGVARNTFNTCQEKQETENTLVQKLMNEHPLVVRDPAYAHIPSVKRATS